METKKNLMALSENLRREGNDLLGRGMLDEAIEKYTEALLVTPSDHLLFSNRSAARLLRKQYDLALDDAEQCVKLAPEWGKGYLRKFNGLWEIGDVHAARAICEEAMTRLSSTELECLNGLLGKCDIELFRRRLTGTWAGRVSNEMGGYNQTMIFDRENSVRVEVFGRHQDCTYTIDLSKTPVQLTIHFGPDGGTTSVPYIVEFRDEDSALAMCCPFLVPDIPTELEGPGFVLMTKGDASQTEDPSLKAKKDHVENIRDDQERMRLYLDDFAAIISQSSEMFDLSVPVELQEADEVEANKKVIHVMSLHVKITELEDIYGAKVAKSSFGIISGGDDYHSSSAEVQAAALRLRELLLATGFITPEALEQARIQYTKTSATSESAENSHRSRLQKKLLERRTSNPKPAPVQVKSADNDSHVVTYEEADIPEADSNPEVCDSNSKLWSRDIIFLSVGIITVALGTGLWLHKRMNRM
jgi:tetratricopeptide (TPR) repeat protein